VLRVDRWRELSAQRRALVLRAWLRSLAGRGPAETLVRRLLDELPQPGPARWPLDAGRELQRYRGRLSVHPVHPSTLAPAAPVQMTITEAGDHRVDAWGGTLRVTPVSQGGIALARLRCCELRPRQGGERFSAGPGRPARSLKKQFQAQGVGPCAREVPLLYCDGRLAFVPGLGIPADELAGDGVPQAALDWLADTAPIAAPQ
jgi:tRNA(Ile)-lysidine synthase